MSVLKFSNVSNFSYIQNTELLTKKFYSHYFFGFYEFKPKNTSFIEIYLFYSCTYRNISEMTGDIFGQTADIKYIY